MLKDVSTSLCVYLAQAFTERHGIIHQSPVILASVHQINLDPLTLNPSISQNNITKKERKKTLLTTYTVSITATRHFKSTTLSQFTHLLNYLFASLYCFIPYPIHSHEVSSQSPWPCPHLHERCANE